MTKTEKQKMLAGEFYTAVDDELQADQAAARHWMERYNRSIALTPQQHADLLQEGLGTVGNNCVVRPPFHLDYGYNITLGDGVFMNFNCVILDVVQVEIGDGTQIGPGVQILTADHPREPALRAQGLEFGRPIKIGKNVWIGAGALIMPGVTIGDDALIGAGSVVTRDVAPGVTVVGNPARSR
ncbi:sugar O-acetyltransferase [Duganella sp. FT27W]|uniref:sugar O-acetyltransferase n=1 Tax=Duganella sp. FT27W TaxID=2654636 RepID=UPI00135D5BAC|nr:sugar O-acetyltransferase [Duganella sp. FT27W]